jgi:MFS family permease
MSLALDYSMTLVTIQALYYVLGGPPRLYGLAYGSYDLASLIFAPLFGLWHDATGKYRPQSYFGITINVIGNIIYAFTFLTGKWWVILVARLLEGAGAALMSTGESVDVSVFMHSNAS